MSITGGCECNNIRVTWHCIDYSVVPRACQCDYCLSKAVAYVSKSATRFDILVYKEQYYRQVQQYSDSATFHQCTHCDQVICVTLNIDGELYGALNANHLINKFGFSAAAKANFSAQTAEQKRQHWRQNGCHPVLITLHPG